jgi:hypothetical protein
MSLGDTQMVEQFNEAFLDRVWRCRHPSPPCARPVIGSDRIVHCVTISCWPMSIMLAVAHAGKFRPDRGTDDELPRFYFSEIWTYLRACLSMTLAEASGPMFP